MTYDFSVLRVLRKKQGMTIAQLSEKCGVSYVALSKLERNQGNPELKTLDRISRALGLPTHNLLALAERKHPVESREERFTVLETADARFVDLDGTRMLIVDAPAGANGYGPEFHRDDYERCFVLEGKLRIMIRGSEYILGPGDGLVWDCVFDHNYEALEPSKVVILLTPKHP
jgi:transcriptional regulator with XRE-family HTH domain